MRGIILSFLLLLLFGVQASGIPSLMIEPGVDDFNLYHPFTLTQTTFVDSFEVDMFNIKGNFTFSLENTSNATVQVLTDNRSDFPPYELIGNVTDLSQSDFDLIHNVGPYSSIYLAYFGSFGCSDCYEMHRWTFTLIEGDTAELILQYTGSNIRQNEEIPNEFQGEFLVIVLVVAAVPVLYILRPKKH